MNGAVRDRPTRATASNRSPWRISSRASRRNTVPRSRNHPRGGDGPPTRTALGGDPGERGRHRDQDPRQGWLGGAHRRSWPQTRWPAAWQSAGNGSASHRSPRPRPRARPGLAQRRRRPQRSPDPDPQGQPRRALAHPRRAPLRNRTVDLLLTMDACGVAVTGARALSRADAGCRWQSSAGASPRWPGSAPICPLAHERGRASMRPRRPASSRLHTSTSAW